MLAKEGVLKIDLYNGHFTLENFKIVIFQSVIKRLILMKETHLMHNRQDEVCF